MDKAKLNAFIPFKTVRLLKVLNTPALMHLQEIIRKDHNGPNHHHNTRETPNIGHDLTTQTLRYYGVINLIHDEQMGIKVMFVHKSNATSKVGVM